MQYAESGWERTSASPAVDEDFVQRCLAPWPELTGRPWSVLSGGLRNLHVRIGDVVARIDTAEHCRLPMEAALHRLVAPAVVVPHIVDVSDTVLLMEYVPHEKLPGTEEAGEQTGRAAAAIHTHTYTTSGFLDARLEVPDPFRSSYDGLREWAATQLTHESLAPWHKRVAAAWDAAESRMRAASRQPVLTHADFKPANVKWLPAQGDVVVFDWEFAWSGAALMDLGQMIRWGVPDPFLQGLVRGYGELPDDWVRLAELFDLFNMVGFVAQGEGRPIRTRDAIARMERTLG